MGNPAPENFNKGDDMTEREELSKILDDGMAGAAFPHGVKHAIIEKLIEWRERKKLQKDTIVEIFKQAEFERSIGINFKSFLINQILVAQGGE
jgi:hypothetical protein